MLNGMFDYLRTVDLIVHVVAVGLFAAAGMAIILVLRR